MWRGDESVPVLEATLLATALLAVYLSNGKTLGSGDTLPARYLPLALLQDGTFHLDAFPILYDERAREGRIDGLPYYLVRAKGHYVSWYPVGAPLLAVPPTSPPWLPPPTDDPGLAGLEKPRPRSSSRSRRFSSTSSCGASPRAPWRWPW